MDKKLEEAWKKRLESKNGEKKGESAGLTILMYIWLMIGAGLVYLVFQFLTRKMRIG